ncbi:hypothetical protein V8G54_023487 [Vigna mungo]|uniref:Uncharacterized protein n=1 Tax=Vigna mungo TaxID=3915 RepID=A0AAQ3N509_VIGMU
MEIVDPEVSITCMDLNNVKKTFQLALLCTKGYRSEKLTMHEVARVLASLLLAPPSNIFAPPSKTIDYAQFVIQKGNNLQPPQMERLQSQKWKVLAHELQITGKIHTYLSGHQWGHFDLSAGQKSNDWLLLHREEKRRIKC